MQTVILVIHLIVVIALIITVLLQKSEGGGLGIGGGGGGLVSVRGSASFMTRTTGILAFAFFVTSLTLAIMSSDGGDTGRAFMEDGPTAPTAPAEPEQPAQPGVPLSQ